MRTSHIAPEWIVLAVGALVLPTATVRAQGGQSVPEDLEFPAMRWNPVTASGNVTCEPGTPPCGPAEIILSGGGVTVTLFLEMAGWDPDQDGEPLLGAFQGSVDATTYEGGLGPGVAHGEHPGNPGTLSGFDLVPVGYPDMGFEGAFQALKVCGPLVWPAPPELWDLMSNCTEDHRCPAGKFCRRRENYVFYHAENTPTVSTATYDYSWSAATTDCPWDSDWGPYGRWRYGGTLLLDVPAGAEGTYNVGFINDSNFTLLNSCPGALIPGLATVPGQITVATGRCCSNISVSATVCEDGLMASECDTRPGPRDFGPFESCDSGPDCNANGVPDDCEPDGDGDGVTDACDGCPSDPYKTDPGLCGCGVPYTDSDCDGVADAEDECPGLDDNLFAPACTNAIPAVSEWGLVILALLLLATGKLYFSRRCLGRARSVPETTNTP